jgi:hypothetical protein
MANNQNTAISDPFKQLDDQRAVWFIIELASNRIVEGYYYRPKPSKLLPEYRWKSRAALVRP